MRRSVFFTFCCTLLLIWSVTAQAKTEEEYQQEILTLRKHNTQLENQLEQVSSDLKRCTEEGRILQRQIAKMVQEGEQNAQELQETRESMKQVRSQLETLLAQQTEASKASHKQQQIEDQLAQTRQRVQQLEKDLQTHIQEKRKLEEQLAAANKQPPAAKTQELQAQQSELGQMRDQFKANLALLHEREQALQQASQKIEALQQEVSLLQILVKQQKEQAQKGETFKEQQTQERQRIEELEAALAEMNSRLARMAEEKSELEAQLSQAGQSELDAANRKMADLQNEVDTLRNWIKQQKQQSQQKQTSSDQSIEAQKRITELEATLAEVNAKLLRTVDEKAQLEAQLRAQQPSQAQELAANQEIQRLEGELRKAADYIHTLNQEVEKLRQQNSDFAAQLTDAQNSLEDVRQQLTDRSDTVQTHVQHTAQLQAQLTETQAQVKAAEQQKQQLQEQLARAEAQLQEQGSVPEAAKQRIEELTLELQETKTLLDQQQRYEKEYPLLQQELATLRAQLADLSKEQERANTLSQKTQEFQTAYEQAKKELDAVASANLELKAKLQNQEGQRQTQEEKYQEILARNQGLEQQYQEGRQELDLKERLLQQALTEKSMLEKFIDEKGSPFDELKARLQQVETENVNLRKQVQELNAMQIRAAESPQLPSASLTTLQQQLLTEKTLRQQLEARLQQAGQGGRAAENWPKSLFPPEVLQQAAGGALTMLGWSPDHSKLAYQETLSTLERLWIFDQRTQVPQKITEWQRSSSGEATQAWLAWAHDNEHFLLSTGIPGQYTLYAGNSTQLFSPPIQLRDQSIHFAWSPTQLQFAYFSGQTLVVSTVRGETLPIQIGHQPGAEGTALAWSPDGTRIAFSSKRGTSFDIFTLLFSHDAPLLQTLVASSSDDIQPAWSPDGRHIAFYVRSSQYDTKLAVTPMDKSRSPYIVAHNVSLPSEGGPVWSTNTSLLYVGEEYLSASQNFVYSVDIATGQRSAAPLAFFLSR